MPPVPGFIGPSYISQALTADNEDLINWYSERMESQGATTDMAYYPTPGVDELSRASEGSGRAHFFMDGLEFCVIGSKFIEIDVTGVQTVRGTVAVDGNPASISSNGDGGGQIFVTSATNGYIFDLLTSVFTQIVFLDGKATFGNALDGYFLALDASTSTFYISALLDGTTWDPLDFAQRSIAPDPWISMEVSGRYVWLFGEQTSEAWYNTGASPFPFAPYAPGFILFGIAAPYSKRVLGKDLIWLARSRDGQNQVLSMAGFTPEVISTYPLQFAISNYSTFVDAQGDSYSDLGHNFYLLTFVAVGVTWAYDTETRQWAKRGAYISEEGRYDAWRPRWHAFAFGQHRFLDSESAAVYNVSVNFLLDVDDRPIRRLRRAPALVDELRRVFYSSFQIDLQPATTTVISGQGEDPQVMMRFSDDGGQTWSSEQWRSAGKIGKYDTRVEWFRLGCGRRRVFEVVVSDPVPFRLTNAYIELGQPIEQQGGGQR
jgi:hypothetical protein